jgi:sarcosine oxidase subunit gamma
MTHVSSNTELSLLDLTEVPRAGVKGKDMSPWIESNAITIGDESNRAYLQSDGSLIVRLSPGELLMLADPSSPTDPMTEYELDPSYTCYPVRRRDSHYWFSLCGERCSELFAKLCAVDLSAHNFANHSVAQTSVARCSAIIIRHDAGDLNRYYLLGDSSMTQYVLSCLHDAMAESGDSN